MSTDTERLIRQAREEQRRLDAAICATLHDEALGRLRGNNYCEGFAAGAERCAAEILRSKA